MTTIHRSKTHAIVAIIVRMLQDNGASIQNDDKVATRLFDWVENVRLDQNPSDETLADLATELADLCKPVTSISLTIPDGLSLNMTNYLGYLTERHRYIERTPINQPMDYVAIVRLIAANV